MSPSRELAIQTLKVVKEMSKGTDLRSILLVGGDSLEEQFGSVMGNPDIIVATPGRFLHLIVEMNLDLRSVQYAVFDEADRLFEMGFEAQLTEILHKLPPSRQTLLFSATLPASLVEFAKAGLQDPLLIRLDVEQKISEDLETAFFTIQPIEKQAGLLYILQNIIKVPIGNPDATSNDATTASTERRKRKRDDTTKLGIAPTSTLIFVSTKHQVEFISALLRRANYSVSQVYGSLDQVARKENVEAFRSGQSSILVVTDVAARGIDIPILSNVINYDFPSEPKVFVHRVGRTARAGQRGWAYSLVTIDDASYFVQLVEFLGRKLVWNGEKEVNFAKDVAAGTIPRGELERLSEWVARVIDESSELSALKSVASKGEKLYLKTRGAASSDMIKKAKTLVQEEGWRKVNPLVAEDEKPAFEDARMKLLESVSGFRPKETVFEIGHKGSKGKTLAAEIMRTRRAKITIKSDEPEETTNGNTEHEEVKPSLGAGTFRDPENYIAHFEPGNTAEERGYDVNRPTHSFAEASRAAVMNLQDDDGATFAPSRPKIRWDPKKKNFVSRANDEDGSGEKSVKMIKGESGVKIPASMKSGRYLFSAEFLLMFRFEEWQKAHKTSLPQVGMSENSSNRSGAGGRKFKHMKSKAPKAPDRFRDDYHVQKKKYDQSAEARKEGDRLRTLDQIRKARALKDKKKQKNARPTRRK